MVKSLYTDPGQPATIANSEYSGSLCEHVFDREDVNNTYKSNDYIEFYWRYVSLFNKCRFFKK